METENVLKISSLELNFQSSRDNFEMLHQSKEGLIVFKIKLRRLKTMVIDT